jgi:predicted nuclease of predicted toxin-antitoxin system
MLNAVLILILKNKSVWKELLKSITINLKISIYLKQKDLEDKEIFMQANQKGNITIITKDAGYPSLVTQYGCSPKIIKLNIGNLHANYFGISMTGILNQQ